MRILMVNTRHYRGGGDSNYAFNLADLLREHGHAVSFFAMQGQDNLPDANSELFVSEIDYREMNRRKNLLTAGKVAWRSIYSLEARRKFASMLARVRPDVVHLHNIHAHITPSIIFEAKKQAVPVVWTLHDYKLICPNSHFLIDQTGEICEACQGGRFWQALHMRCKKGSLLASGMASLEAYAHQIMNVRGQVATFLCPSAFLRAKLLENGFDEQQTAHVPLFMADAQFEQRAEADQGYILFLGKLETLKGIHILLDAARQVPHVNVVLAGRLDEAVRADFEQRLPANVTYVGFKSGQELLDLQRGARAFVLPSLWYENQPLSMLEPFALGKAVIASDLGGMRELVGEHRERGLLTPAGDSRALAQAMDWMCTHAGDAQKMGSAAFAYAQEHHAAEGHFRLIDAIYSKVLMKGGGV